MPNILKRLELNGFKSFAQKTALDFPPGITAIVGPNGSGKSNIVDAIRWLLGERDAKNLRGGKVEDLIFAGTPERGRLGQAQASLYFENSNKFFPVEFAEVSVMRQVSRDGMSRYFLNKSEILLRDLIDFFAKVRLGSRGLVVITQGNSDLFIQATPLNRREMIEEILGLREYQMKKVEAERRFKQTTINLEKVKALTEEILPHLRSLKRQTARWEKREVFQDELKQLENELFGSQWSEYEKAFKEVEKELEAHEKETAVLQKKKQIAEEEQSQVEASQPKEREELQLIKKNINQILENRGALQKDLGRLEAQIESLGKAEGEGELAVSAETLTRSLKKVEVLLRDALKKDSEAARRMMTDALREIEMVFLPLKKQSSQTPQMTAVKIEFNQLGRDLKELEVSLRELKEKEAALEKNQAHFYEAFKSAVRAVEHAKEEIEKWENQHQAKRFQKERLLLRRTELERQIQQAGRKVEEFRATRSSGALPTYEIASFEKRIFKLRGDLASIGEIDEALVREAKETETRYEFLSREATDLEKAQIDLRQLSRDLTEKIRVEFDEALHKINKEFSTLFHLMFGGGQAKLYVQHRVPQPKKKKSSDEDEAQAEESKSEVSEEEEREQEEKEGGIEIEVKLPRKRVSTLEMLSGGERSLVGIAALFALISVSPPPFLVLDEIDAALDERNARRFAGMLKEFSKKTQFLVVTHNRATMEAANVLYGVTLNKDGTSKVLSLKLE